MKVPEFRSFENVNPASWKLDGGPNEDIFLAVTDNTVSARIDIDTLAVLEMLKTIEIQKCGNRPAGDRGLQNILNSDDETVICIHICESKLTRVNQNM